MRAPHRKRERGVTAVFVAITLGVVVGFMALAMNMGHLYSVRGELQNAADSGALAGAKDIKGKADLFETARQNARTFMQRHATDSQIPVTVHDSMEEVATGYWNRETYEFTPIAPGAALGSVATCASLPCVNAVRVRTFRDAAHAKTVDVWFGAFLGKQQQDVTAVACAATGGLSQVGCADLPLTIPRCNPISQVLGEPCTPVQDYVVKFAADGTDSGAWTTLQESSGGGADLITCLIEDLRDNDGRCKTNTECGWKSGGADTEVSINDPLWVSNGTVNTACMKVRELWQEMRNHEYVIPVANVNCTPGEKWVQKYVQTWPIAGFATIRISDVVCDGKDKHIKIDVMCKDKPVDGEGGGPAFGTWAKPKLVHCNE